MVSAMTSGMLECPEAAGFVTVNYRFVILGHSFTGKLLEGLQFELMLRFSLKIVAI